MAGVTNPAFRKLCREQGESATIHRPAGVFTCEMITARGVADRIPKTLEMMAPDAGDDLFSVQLSGVDPATMSRGVERTCGEFGVRHIDLNFGCPVPKITRKGGGGVLAWKLDRFRAILQAATSAAAPFKVPVTIKIRIGIDEHHTTMLDVGRIAEDTGISAITLHARTVNQAYSGQANWEAIAHLVEQVSLPIIGNGDIWEASDALAMMNQTGCAGVAIGRGALGRPWLFHDLAAALSGQDYTPTLPTSRQVVEMVRRHGELLVEHFQHENHGLADLRKHMSWYFKGFSLGGELRYKLGLVSSLTQLDELLAQVEEEPFPVRELQTPRGRQGSPRSKVAMPYGWLDTRTLDTHDLTGADIDAQGG
ncbi:MAG: tRNA dihydrouridine synthase DusB [Propionibacteriaceae bacterium]|nr:tRNA dihydrouridine synthase DusB [Propionibacteriaceae bacterium]